MPDQPDTDSRHSQTECDTPWGLCGEVAEQTADRDG